MQTSSTVEMVTISRAEYERLQQEKARNAKLEAKLAAREQEQRVGKRIQFKLLLDEPRQTIYAFAQIRVAAGDIDLICTGEIVQHRRRSSTSSLSCSALQPG